MQFTLKITVLCFKGMHIFQFLEYLLCDIIVPTTSYEGTQDQFMGHVLSMIVTFCHRLKIPQVGTVFMLP